MQVRLRADGRSLGGAGCAPWAWTLPSPSPALPEVSWTPALGGGASSQAQVTELCTPKKHDANSLAQVTGRHRVHLRVVVRPAAPPAGAARRGVRYASLSARGEFPRSGSQSPRPSCSLPPAFATRPSSLREALPPPPDCCLSGGDPAQCHSSGDPAPVSGSQEPLAGGDGMPSAGGREGELPSEFCELQSEGDLGVTYCPSAWGGGWRLMGSVEQPQSGARLPPRRGSTTTTR